MPRSSGTAVKLETELMEFRRLAIFDLPRGYMGAFGLSPGFVDISNLEPTPLRRTPLDSWAGIR